MEHPEKNAGLVRYVITPHSVDYVLMLANPAVAKRLIEQTDPILFTMTYMSEEDEAKFSNNAKAIITQYPNMKYFYPIRQLSMYILQMPSIPFPQRLLVLNHAMSTVKGMFEQFQPELVDAFAQNITHTTDFTETIKYFDKVPISPPAALTEGVSFLKALYNTAKDAEKESYRKFKPFYERIYKGLGVSGPDTFTQTDVNAFVKNRADFGINYLDARPNIMENIMINYLWAYCVPFTEPQLSVWDNFGFYITLYNAIKIFITLIEPENDEDLIAALSAFDVVLTDVSPGNVFMRKIMQAHKNQNTANNGDLAVITLS
jgi:hypothetical protein